MSKKDGLLKKMENAKKLYGKNVGYKVMSITSKLMDKGERPFKWAHEALGLWEEESNGIDYL